MSRYWLIGNCFVSYINHAENALESHIGEEYKKSSLKVTNVLKFVSLSLEDEGDQSGDELQVRNEFSRWCITKDKGRF